MTIWRRVACWISKATLAQAHARSSAPTHARMHTHAPTQKHVRLIAFPRQQWFRERASVLRYTYIACLLRFKSIWGIVNFCCAKPTSEIHFRYNVHAK